MLRNHVRGGDIEQVDSKKSPFDLIRYRQLMRFGGIEVVGGEEEGLGC